MTSRTRARLPAVSPTGRVIVLRYCAWSAANAFDAVPAASCDAAGRSASASASQASAALAHPVVVVGREHQQRHRDADHRGQQPAAEHDHHRPTERQRGVAHRPCVAIAGEVDEDHQGEAAERGEQGERRPADDLDPDHGGQRDGDRGPHGAQRSGTVSGDGAESSQVGTAADRPCAGGPFTSRCDAPDPSSAARHERSGAAGGWEHPPMTQGTQRTAIVVGGTGPTGPHVVRGLLDRGFAVTIVHTGRHEREEIAGAGRARAHRPVRRCGHRRGARRTHRGCRGGDVRPAARAGRDRRPARRQADHRGRDAGARRLRRSGGARPAGAAGAGVGGRCRDERREQRQGRGHRAHRGGDVRRRADRHPLPLPARLRPAPARAARVDDRAPRARRTSPDHHPRRWPAAALCRPRGQRGARPAPRGGPAGGLGRAHVPRERRGHAVAAPGGGDRRRRRSTTASSW